MAIPDGKPATDFSAMNREWVRAVANEASEGGSTGLPPVTDADNGKILGVVNGAWGAMDAGGGGSSDFSTAEVTMIYDATPETCNFYVPNVYENDIYSIISSDDMGEVFDIVLYKGSATVEIEPGKAVLVTAVTGDIVIGEDNHTAIISGDGSITFGDPSN